MNAATPAEPRWTWRHWGYVIGGVLVLQTGLLLYLGQRDQVSPVRPTFRTAVHFVTDGWLSEQLARLPGVTDPTLLALPAQSSFSGAAWMREAPLGYRPEPWSEPARWLSLDGRALGGGFAQLVATNLLTPPTIADKPALPMLRYEPTFPSDPLPTQSTLRIEGELASRPLFRPVELPAWAHYELLSNSVVQILVDAEGFTLSTEPLSGCGLPEADRHALKLANAARFQPLPRAARDATGRGPLAWGKLIFRWHTTPPAVTNAPAGLP